MIEADLRALLLTLEDVTEIVGDNIRPDRLAQDDDVPAIVVAVDEEQHQNDLSGLGGGIIATVVLSCIATDKETSRDLAEAVRINGTEPGSGLAGYTGPAGDGVIESAVLETTQPSYIAEDDGSDEGWYVTDAIYTIMYLESV